MADHNPPPPPTQPPAPQPPFTHPDPADPQENEITIISHSNLFYWWPVWAVCFLFGILTYFDGHALAAVPADAKVAHNATVVLEGGKPVEKQAIIYMNETSKEAADLQTDLLKPSVKISHHKSYGVIFTFVLLLVIFITNVPLRGMWSLVAIILIAFVVLLFAYFGVWDKVMDLISQLDIRINEGGYFMIGLTLFLLWIITFVLFDRQVYITVTPGNFKVCTEIGGGERVYDTAGMQLEKHRSDLFRHWILGFGSGDLTVQTSGGQIAHVELPNVLFIGRKVEQITNLIKKKAVVETR